jgi:two-component system chemotaxis response regulator CheB
VEILKGLPAGFPVPILVAIHLNAPFGSALAQWLDGQTALRVACAQDGEPVAGAVGRVVLAPPERHLVVRQGQLELTSDPERHSCRPSIDTLFESLAREYGATGLACLLTGMGRDGAEGLLALRRAGGFTIAQDQASCVVYGMPREAEALGAAVRTLPLSEIGPAVAEAVLGSREAVGEAGRTHRR